MEKRNDPSVSNRSVMESCNDEPRTVDETGLQTSKHLIPFIPNPLVGFREFLLNNVKLEPKESPFVAGRETKAVKVLRLAVLLMLVMVAIMVSIGVHVYTRNEEFAQFQSEYQNHAEKIIETFQDAVARRLAAINSMANTITSYSIATNQSFPFVTVPDFAIRGSDLRILADAMIIHYMPLVWDDDRIEWEKYALEHRFHIDQAHEVDVALRSKQDVKFGIVLEEEDGDDGRMLAEMSVVDDGTGFHSKIWSLGTHTPRGDEAEGIGPYLPLWQRSPINNAKQKTLNLNFAGTNVFHGALPLVLQTKEAIMNKASHAVTERGRDSLRENLSISQYRAHVGDFIDDPLTFIAHPIFTSFQDDSREIGGLLATNIHWKVFFQRILPPTARGIVCVLENSYNQTFAYSIDGSEATFLGQEDPHDPEYEDMEEFANVNEYVRKQAGPETESYTAVPLSQKFGSYTLRVYPSRETETSYQTNHPLIYTAAVVSAFAFTSVVFVAFALVVERRQNIVMQTAVDNARKVATTERDLNEFLAHELRNPLSAAISACSFVSSAIGPDASKTVASKKNEELVSLRQDVKVIDTSLHFVNDFLRSMLDMHRAAFEGVELTTAPAFVRRDIIDPVCSMLYQHKFAFSVTADCPENLVVMTDALRMKQVLLSLGANASQFVKTGFVRFRVAVVDGLVEVYVEDSGPGIPADKRGKLFEKYGDRLDELTQGTGIGLQLSKSLISSLHGDLWHDETYDSGLEGAPGARFVIQLKTAPLPSQDVPAKALIGSDVTSNETTEEEPQAVLPDNLMVLFVDDDNILRKLFARAVKKVAQSWTIHQAASGEAALKLVEEETTPFDIIFMDQYMPSTEQTPLLGTETIEKLRSMGVRSRICGLSANDLKDEFLKAGANDFIVKPIPCDKAELESLLLRVLATKESGNEPAGLPTQRMHSG